MISERRVVLHMGLISLSQRVHMNVPSAALSCPVDWSMYRFQSHMVTAITPQNTGHWDRMGGGGGGVAHSDFISSYDTV